MSSTKPWYMTSKQRKRMDAQFQVMLRRNHDSLLNHANERYPETLEEVMEKNPSLSPEKAEKIRDLNVRMNESNRRIEDLIMRIDPRWQD